MDQQAKKAAVFGVILFLALLAVIGIAYAVSTQNYVYLIIGLIILLLLIASTKFDVLLQLQEYERAVVFRFGHFVGVRGPGWTIIIPFIENYVKVDLRTETLDVAPQKVITKDNIKVQIDAVVYLKVSDPAKAVLNVQDYKSAAILYVESTIREIAGRMTAEEIISNVDKINSQLRTDLQRMAEGWGVKVVSVELKRVSLPEELMEAMHQRREAEQRKYAAVQEAEAEKVKIEAVKQAAGELNEKALAYYYLKALEQIASGKATKIVLPLEVSTLAQSISSALGGAVSPKKVEEDLEGKYAYLLDEFKKMLKEKSARKK
ncbi:MAG: hypothetical protein PWQ11_456 [Candidatus Diapherotrites archaeon]|nr:hypothetical protein [Candidatus Diapherotrites archaeon]